MLNQQTIEGHWNELAGKAKQVWGNLTDNDFKSVDGNIDQLVGMIQRKTGESRENIEAKIEEFANGFSTYAEQAAASVRQGAQQVAEKVQAATEHISDTARNTYSDAEAFVQLRPTESVAVAFGAGLIAGVVLGLVLRSR
jgi:uncharacterized protein YjbJ (UPF0337 family)